MDKSYVGRKHQWNLDKVFLFKGTFVDRVLEMERTAPMTKVNSKFTEPSNMFCRPEERIIWSEVVNGKLKKEVKAVKKGMVGQFGLHCQSGLYILKFHLLDHIAEVLDRIGTLSAMGASTYEHYNVLIKFAYRPTTQKRGTELHEIVRNVAEHLSVRKALEKRMKGEQRIEVGEKIRPVLRSG